MKLSQQLLDAIDALDEQRDEKFQELMNILSANAMNTRCDTSAIADEHIMGFKQGHKQARHAIAEMLLSVMADELRAVS